MITFSLNLRLNASKDAIITSSATFVLASIFFVMAFMILPTIQAQGI